MPGARQRDCADGMDPSHAELVTDCWVPDPTICSRQACTASLDAKAFLESKGYQFVTTLEIDDCFILPSAFPTRHAFSRCWRRA